ncbi:terminase small subunit [Salipaludibacillus agaradhaerens]|uniref:Terminase small subunit n=1 Tax=Salipaludibacillus agaradhaerens TaxID=76935 RepID=A0A9Q4B212_SALAG|nr:terminase small subunit [Salipaludibacillus agaradhaerens]MCR6096864.1 terminase small subunit [Salipaludibacillus agaradhaerens]MCR6116708.1 terminase small subunit [Salipaludibacillus agaradhaerens]
MSKLTEKQKRFVDCYVESGNGTQSYIDAGYKATSRAVAEANARKLLANYSVKKYMEERMKKIESEKIASQEEILSYLTSVLRGETTEEVLRGVGKGAQTVDSLEVSAKDRIKAAELLGKRYAIWTDNKNIDVQGVVTFVDDIGDEDET